MQLVELSPFVPFVISLHRVHLYCAPHSLSGNVTYVLTNGRWFSSTFLDGRVTF